ncbi:uncharacterized protein BDV17DRAFT_293769 [Aspergillus undulatus]|uniref:uncharacterized protein n=1 Tax=Aspergillus undulatus TaxID=1810928 RepID=UPI003CCCC9BD
MADHAQDPKGLGLPILIPADGPIPQRQPLPSLLTLPPNLQVRILSHLPQKDLPAVLKTCKDLKTITEPLLYRTVTLEPRRGLLFIKTLGHNTRLQGYVQSLTIHDHHTVETQFAQIMARFILHLTNLRRLRIKGCFTHFLGVPSAIVEVQRKLYVETLGAGGLDRLVSLEISLSNSEPWPLAARECIFWHPTLKYLSVLGCTMDDFHSFTHTIHHTSPLECLSLICCDISAATLAKILSVPRALRQFVMLGPVQQAGTSKPEYTNPNPALYIEALKPQAHSLQFIRLVTWYFRASKVPVLDFSGFVVLKELTFSTLVLLDGVTGWTQNLTPLATRRPFPPSLRALSIFHLNAATLSATESILAGVISRLVAEGSVPDLRTVTLVTPRAPPVDLGSQPLYRGTGANRLDFLETYVLPDKWNQLMMGRVLVCRIRIPLMWTWPLRCECCDFDLWRVVVVP